jgi:hypothetical protein
VLANYGFAIAFAAPKLAGLRHLVRSEAEGQCYVSPKNEHSEANRLAIAALQNWAMLWLNCRVLRPRLEKGVAVGAGNSD